MIVRKASLAGSAGFLSMALVAAAGCGPAEEVTAVGDAPRAAAANPREALLKAVPDAKVGAYRFDIKGGQTPLSGVLDAPAKTFEMKIVEKDADIDMTLSMTWLLIEDKGWLKIAITPAGLPGLPKLPKKWSLLDPAKIKDPEISRIKYADETDPGYVGDLVEHSADLRESSPGHYAGTTDLTQSTDAEIVDEKTLTALGAKAKSVPFTAVVDAAGHLTSAVVKVPATGKTKAVTYRVSYTGFGSVKSPAEPAADQQIAAPAAVYEILNG